jgi:hypothetical protein
MQIVPAVAVGSHSRMLFKYKKTALKQHSKEEHAEGYREGIFPILNSASA